MTNLNVYRNPYGMWEVITTNGDVEGRTVKRLGVYKGYIDEIAFALADQCGYELEFRPFKFSKIPVPGSFKEEVPIRFDIESKTWNISSKERVKFFSDIFAERNVDIKKGAGYGTVMLCRNKDELLEAKRKAALNKLTDEEKEILGLSFYDSLCKEEKGE